jgi:hypothetical protein
LTSGLRTPADTGEHGREEREHAEDLEGELSRICLANGRMWRNTQHECRENAQHREHDALSASSRSTKNR